MKFFPDRTLRRRARPLAVLLLGLLPSCEVEGAHADRMPRLLSTGFPLRIECEGRELLIEAPPERVLPTNAAWVDFLSLLLPPARVVALPSEAFGYSRLTRDSDDWAALPELPVFEGERILALTPDLVLAHSWQNPGTLRTLRDADIPVLVVPVPESWDEILRTIELLGAVLGVPTEATELLAQLQARRLRLATRARPFAGMRALTYTNLGAGGWTAGARTTGHILLELAGLENAAASAGLSGDVPADHERVLSLAPDLFLVGRPDRSESSPPSATFLLSEPSLQGLEAIRAGRILSLPPALFTSASPELLVGAERVVRMLEDGWSGVGASGVTSGR